MVLNKTITVQNVMEILLVTLLKTSNLLLQASETNADVIGLMRFMMNLDVFTKVAAMYPNYLQKNYFQGVEEKKETKVKVQVYEPQKQVQNKKLNVYLKTPARK